MACGLTCLTHQLPSLGNTQRQCPLRGRQGSRRSMGSSPFEKFKSPWPIDEGSMKDDPRDTRGTKITRPRKWWRSSSCTSITRTCGLGTSGSIVMTWLRFSPRLFPETWATKPVKVRHIYIICPSSPLPPVSDSNRFKVTLSSFLMVLCLLLLVYSTIRQKNLGIHAILIEDRSHFLFLFSILKCHHDSFSFKNGWIRLSLSLRAKFDFSSLLSRFRKTFPYCLLSTVGDVGNRYKSITVLQYVILYCTL